MEMLSWNVNGIRSAIKKGFLEFAKNRKPEIFALQEIKGGADESDKKLDGIYTQRYWNPAERKGYSGTAVFANHEPLKVKYGIEKQAFDVEGRSITLEYPNFFFVNLYAPNAGHGLPRLEFKQKWDKAVRAYLKRLDRKKPVVFCGDMNVAHKEIDLKNPKQNKKNAGFTQGERDGFTKHLEAGFVDTFRHMHSKKVAYSWWSYRFNARKRNIGWRVDYFCISKRIKSKLEKAFILQDVKGSDHAPVGIEIKLRF